MRTLATILGFVAVLATAPQAQACDGFAVVSPFATVVAPVVQVQSFAVQPVFAVRSSFAVQRFSAFGGFRSSFAVERVRVRDIGFQRQVIRSRVLVR